MDHAHPLSGLAGMVAALRAQGRTARLALHNTERFGLIHLYFSQGRLIRVEGHAGDPARNLMDLRTWQSGAVRVDDVEAPAGVAASPAVLEAELHRTLAELERRGIVYPAPPAASPDSPFYVRSSPGMAGGPDGLPPLDRMQANNHGTSGNAATGQPSQYAEPAREPANAQNGPRLTVPQWQLLALAVRQVTEHIAQLLGGKIAESILRNALSRANYDSAFLQGLEVDQTGWLRARDQAFVMRYSTFDAAEAVALLLTQMEQSVAEVVGPQRAQSLIAGAVAPFRTSLEQIGLTIRAS
jgi:hypothetical protein